MSRHLGDFDPSAVVYGKFTTYRPSTGAPYTLGGTPALSVYKDNSTTQSTTGVTLTADFDSVAGLNHFAIDTSADGTFYAAGSFFDVVITTGTVDGVSSVGSVVGSFTLRKTAALKPTTAGRTLDVAATGEAGLDFNNVLSSSLVTLHSLTVSGAVSLGAGLAITQSTTNGSGISVIGNGNGAAIRLEGGATGDAVLLVGGSTSGDGLRTETTEGHGFNLSASGTNAHGLLTTGGTAGICHGWKAVAGTGGDAVYAPSVTASITGSLSGAIGSVASGGITAASFAAGAIDAAAIATDAIGSAEISAAAVTKIQAGLSTYAGGDTSGTTTLLSRIPGTVQPQTGDAYALIGTAGSGLTAIGDTRLANLDAAVSSRMASYTQPTGFLAATFPATVASPTNITGGTITTVTNLTNLPAITADWITAAGLSEGAVAEIQSGLSTLDAAGVRSAVGLASANLDAQLDGLPTVAELTARTLAAADYATATDLATVDGVADAIKTKTDNLPAAPAAVSDVPTVSQIWAKAMAELSSVPGVTASVLDALNWVFTVSRNKITQTNATQTVYKDDGSTALATSALSDDGSTFTRAEFS